MKRLLFFLTLVVGSLPLEAQYKINNLNKVFHHKGKLSDKVSCYFSSEPLCNSMPDRPGGEKTVQGGTWQTVHFFFPMTVIGTAECKKMVEQLNGAENNLYAVQFESVTKPIKGLALVIRYDASKLGFEYKTFTSIQQQSGIVFKFHYKDVLKEISQKTNSLQYYACNNPKVHVVIDNGHGGDDEGKVGCFNIKEKNINLTVGTQLASLLRAQGYRVSLTRTIDSFVSLEDRTTFANKIAKADLFVSIHSNGAQSPKASGIETFYAQSLLFKNSMKKHLDEKSAGFIHELEERRHQKSSELAGHIHNHTLASAREKNATILDRKVKTAISQVLLGTEMPCALIEIGFLSNEHEARLLMHKEYQAVIAQGICKGIMAYVKSLRTV